MSTHWMDKRKRQNIRLVCLFEKFRRHCHMNITVNTQHINCSLLYIRSHICRTSLVCVSVCVLSTLCILCLCPLSKYPPMDELMWNSFRKSIPTIVPHYTSQTILQSYRIARLSFSLSLLCCFRWKSKVRKCFGETYTHISTGGVCECLWYWIRTLQCSYPI